MSLFGRAVAGFGQGAATLANKYIDEELAQQRAQFMSDLQVKQRGKIEEQEQSPEWQARRNTNAAAATAAQSAAQDDAKLASLTREPLNTALRAKAAGDVEAASEAQRKAELARLGDEPLQASLLAKGRRDALAGAETAADVAKQQASDPEYLKAQKTLALADPKVAASIEASRASAANAFAAAAQHKATTEGIKAINADRKRLDGLYDDAQKILADKDLTNDERKVRMTDVMQQAALIKSKNAAPAGKDPELDTQTVTEEKMNADGTTTKTTRKEVRRPGGERAQPDDPIKAAMDAARAKPGSSQAADPTRRDPTRRDPISGEDLNEAQWNKRFGRGDFKRYSDGLPSMKPF